MSSNDAKPEIHTTYLYLYVGNIPCKQYSITITPDNISLSSFWPKNSGVIFSEGTLFDDITGKKLPYDSDVIAGHNYYLLTQHPVYEKYARLICETFAPHWYIYDVCTNFDEDAARFFLNYHCILTEKPADIIPVWPLYVRKPYLLYHLSDKVSFFLKGNVKLDNVNLGYDFITDMLVLEFSLDPHTINCNIKSKHSWKQQETCYISGHVDRTSQGRKYFYQRCIDEICEIICTSENC